MNDQINVKLVASGNSQTKGVLGKEEKKPNVPHTTRSSVQHILLLLQGFFNTVFTPKVAFPAHLNKDIPITIKKIKSFAINSSSIFTCGALRATIYSQNLLTPRNYHYL